MSITVSAPGKLMLMGDHAVVYGRPCLVAAVDKYLTVKAGLSDGQNDVFVTPKESNQTFLLQAIKLFREHYLIKEPVVIETESELGNYGLGSSSAVTVATIKALSELFKQKITDRELFDLSFKAVLAVQGLGSGFDVASAIYGGIIYFVSKGEMVERLPGVEMNLVIGYSGIKADTVKMVKSVEEKMKQYPSAVEKIFDNIADLVEKGKKAINEKDWFSLGKYLNYHQDYLEDLGISTPKLEAMITAARDAGALGAKLSGAGGGDCMIALICAEKKVEVKNAIEKAGGEIIDLKISSEGVKVL
ncbi:mevalonate kinase [Candidatus Microgenomates bacterium]|nr:mevalonate kinase [Candidatus Microgenomates bacterium]